MNSLLRPLPTLLFLLASMAGLRAEIERILERSFDLPPGAKVVVDLSNGPIEVVAADTATVTARLGQQYRAKDDAAADAIAGRHDIAITREGDTVRVVARRKGDSSGWSFGRQPVRFAAKLTVPRDADLNLDTAGGSISINGDTRGPVVADTSGGSITLGGRNEGPVVADTAGGSIDVAGGPGSLKLDTAGGSIRVGEALSEINADTAGGSIRIGYVGPAATRVRADTSGGSIRIGVDPAAKLDVTADTSGGSVEIEDLTFVASRRTRSHATGTLNGGGAGTLVADTSGGGITISAAKR